MAPGLTVTCAGEIVMLIPSQLTPWGREGQGDVHCGVGVRCHGERELDGGACGDAHGVRWEREVEPR